MTKDFILNTRITKMDDLKTTNGIISHRFNDIILLRRNVKDFLNEIIPTIKNKTVLEIGPIRDVEFINNPVKQVQECFVDTKKELEALDNKYLTCDMKSNIKSDYDMDVIKLPKVIGKSSIDVIIACEVLEHSPEFWKMPKVFYDLLSPKGEIYITTPFFTRHHDPKPDYWRFTEDGLKLLFSKYFNLEITKLLWKNDDGQTPIHITLKGVKK